MPNVHMAEATLAEAQLNDPATSEAYQTQEGMTDGTMHFAALNRIAESNLAIAYEQRTRNLLAMLQLANTEGWAKSADAEIARTMVIEALDIAPLTEIVDGIRRGKDVTPDQIGDRRKMLSSVLESWDTLRQLNRADARDALQQIARQP